MVTMCIYTSGTPWVPTAQKSKGSIEKKEKNKENVSELGVDEMKGYQTQETRTSIKNKNILAAGLMSPSAA